MSREPSDPSLPARLREFYDGLPLAGDPPTALLALPDDRLLAPRRLHASRTRTPAPDHRAAGPPTSRVTVGIPSQSDPPGRNRRGRPADLSHFYLFPIPSATERGRSPEAPRRIRHRCRGRRHRSGRGRAPGGRGRAVDADGTGPRDGADGERPSGRRRRIPPRPARRDPGRRVRLRPGRRGRARRRAPAPPRAVRGPGRLGLSGGEPCAHFLRERYVASLRSHESRHDAVGGGNASGPRSPSGLSPRQTSGDEQRARGHREKN